MDPLNMLLWLLVVVAGLVICGVIGILIFFGMIGVLCLKVGKIFLEEIKTDKEKKL